jgi:hypothetical protein
MMHSNRWFFKKTSGNNSEERTTTSEHTNDQAHPGPHSSMEARSTRPKTAPNSRAAAAASSSHPPSTSHSLRADSVLPTAPVPQVPVLPHLDNTTDVAIPETSSLANSLPFSSSSQTTTSLTSHSSMASSLRSPAASMQTPSSMSPASHASSFSRPAVPPELDVAQLQSPLRIENPLIPWLMNSKRGCFQRHRTWRKGRNDLAPTACALCFRHETDDRYTCAFCALRVCSRCKNKVMELVKNGERLPANGFGSFGKDTSLRVDSAHSRPESYFPEHAHAGGQKALML